MKKYLTIVLKSMLKFCPFVLIVTLVLFLGFAIIFNEMVKLENADADNMIFKVGITGDTDNNYFKLGKSALQTFDSSRFAIEIIEMSEEDAQKSLNSGIISAYVVMPENFIKDAIHGNLKSIKYITSSGSVGMVSIFKDEITRAVEELVVHSQKGVFGLEETLLENGFSNEAYDYVDNLNFEYIEFIVHRSNMYKVTELGIGDGLPFGLYMICGISVLLILLTQLPFGAVFIKRDRSLSKLLKSGAVSPTKQVLSEFIAFFMVLTAILFIILGLFCIALSIFDFGINKESLSVYTILKFGIGLLPVLGMLVAFGNLIFSLGENIINGVLMHFFISLSLCYISGCLYPIYTFPKFIQKLSVFLPTGFARGFIANCFTEDSIIFNFTGLAVYTVVFISLTVLIKNVKINDKG